ncbi:hypothetical protein M0411_21100 [Xanthomonas hortorum pv. vitians]|uniref:hypothetical protein n=1 Tax=Xanthomonas hortorum TaxID=56454 RepID=UPI001652DD8F|nr:hypothetical protein [Xanthomonas hortorum]MCE4300314.1 hypothetical protein [Xanthomonas hortorum pv. vitians]MCE4369160.1 hypothetical protein [Xanthomonas hortorum pv. vitians]MDA4141529.1 hypothetical protein [Xanthomonas hortorum pv. vitians]QNM61241.1 hypothetical protein XHV734_2473 [Xanthomonas hortorum pv. vitians]
MTGLIAFSLLGVACFVCSIGTARLVGWILDRRDAAILRQLREQDLIAAAEREHDRALFDYVDPVAAAAEERADRLNDATMCEAEWSR